MAQEIDKSHYQITASELPLHCPLPNTALWNSHPRVYMPIEKTGEASCPYCGTHYTLEGGPAKSSGH